MAIELGRIRLGLYITSLVFTVILFTLCIARVVYTENLPRGDPLNVGRDFYDPVIAELLFTTIVNMGWCVFMLVAWFKRLEIKYFRLFRDEVIVLAIIWSFWIGGTASASTLWGSLNFCQRFQTCQVLSTLVAFCWLGFVALLAIIAVDFRMALGGGGLMTPLPVRGARGVSTEGTKESENTGEPSMAVEV